MRESYIFLLLIVLCVNMSCSSKGLTTDSDNSEKVEILKVTVGEPTSLSDIGYQNRSSLAISRTGIVAAFYPVNNSPILEYRTSEDAGQTWNEPMIAPKTMAGGALSIGLRDGGVIKFCTHGTSWHGELDFTTSPLEGEFIDGWFTLHSTFAWFSDDFSKYETAPVRVYMPDAVTTKVNEFGPCIWPIFDKGKIIQLEDGLLLAPMYGHFKGDHKYRILISSSSDQGHTWRYYSTIAVLPSDPDPELPGDFTWYGGLAEPTIAMLPNGQMLCVVRTQGSQMPAQYRPLYTCWSDDLGKTWTKPVTTKPHLMSVWPTLQVLDNGVVACSYGRPGLHVAFSLDNGHTWQDRITFSDLPEPVITSYSDIIKVGPDKLLVIGGLGPDGTKVFPITVEKIKISPAKVDLTGLVVDENGKAISGAKVETAPNRYEADSWQESTELDPWDIGPVKLIGSPVLGYKSIRKKNSYPVVKTDTQGHFEFESVKLGELILTVEAKGYAPKWQRVNVSTDPNSQSVKFVLKPGKSIHGRILDSDGNPAAGVDVVLNMWHVYSNTDGYFDWAVEQPLPEKVDIKVYKRYSYKYEMLKNTVSLDQLQNKPIILKLSNK